MPEIDRPVISVGVGTHTCAEIVVETTKPFTAVSLLWGIIKVEEGTGPSLIDS